MKNVLKVVLLIAVAGLVFICYRSVMNPIEFQEVKEQREEVVIKRLVDIKKAQEEYYSQNNEYAPDFETLIEFVRTGRMGVVRKIYELNDEQQAYILSYVNDQIKKDNKKRRNSEQVEEYHGLTNNQADSVFLGNGEKFVMETSGMSGTGALFEAYADSYIYLQEINQQELDNYLLEVKKNNRPVRKEYHKDENGVTLRDTEGKEIFDVIPCLKIGDKRIPNKNIGNWE